MNIYFLELKPNGKDFFVVVAPTPAEARLLVVGRTGSPEWADDKTSCQLLGFAADGWRIGSIFGVHHP